MLRKSSPDGKWVYNLWYRLANDRSCSLFVPTMNMKDFEFDLEHRVQRIEEKEDVARHESTVSP
jgi:hypothetical protein